MVGSRPGGQLSLLRTADGGDDRGVGPPGQLNAGAADRSGPTGDQHRATLQRPRTQSGRPVLGHGQAAVGGHERHSETRTEVEAGPVGE